MIFRSEQVFPKIDDYIQFTNKLFPSHPKNYVSPENIIVNYKNDMNTLIKLTMPLLVMRSGVGADNPGYIAMTNTLLETIYEHVKSNTLEKNLKNVEMGLLDLSIIIINCRENNGRAKFGMSTDQLDTISRFIKTYIQKQNEKNILPIAQCISEDPVQALEKLPKTERWRLYIDANKQRKPEEEGWSGYEKREKGCIKNMHTALEYALNIENDITYADIKKIHALALQHSEDPNSMRGNTHLDVYYCSLDGYFNGVEAREKAGVEDFDFINSGSDFRIRKEFGESNSEFEELFNDKMSSYTQALAAAQTAEEKMKAIVIFCADLVRDHPFEDGNCRTYSVVLLNRELIKNGFSPCILNDPNMLEDLMSYNELMNEVVLGIKNFQALLEKQQIIDLPNELKTDVLSKKEAPPDLDDFKINAPSPKRGFAPR